MNENYKVKEYERMIEQQNKTIQTLKNKLKELSRKLRWKRKYPQKKYEVKYSKTKVQPTIKIKLKILNLLKKASMTQLDLTKTIGSSYKAVGQALIYLENLGKVEKVKLNVYDPHTEEKKFLWRLKS